MRVPDAKDAIYYRTKVYNAVMPLISLNKQATTKLLQKLSIDNYVYLASMLNRV